MKNLGINFYHCLPTHLSTILLRKHGPISRSISRRYCRVVVLFSRLFCLVLVSIDYSLKHLAPVYIDETGFDTYFYREYGRSLKGQLIRGKISGRRYQRISLVAGLTNGELIAPMTYEETMTSNFFEAWFQKFLLPTLNTPSVIIMDNARFHRMGKLELLCEEFGHKLLPLPPYSPEYNSIEKKWAHIKKHLKKVLPSCSTFFEVLLSCSCFN